MRKIVKLMVLKLEGSGDYLGCVEVWDGKKSNLFEVSDEDFKVVWDRLTFFVVDYEDKLGAL